MISQKNDLQWHDIEFTSIYQKVFVKKPLVEAAPPSEAVETSERVAARLHAGKRRRALAGGGAVADAVCEPALAHVEILKSIFNILMFDLA